jgi:hypothetical protein
MKISRSPNETLVLGGIPRVHLLPTEVAKGQRAKSQRRLLLAVLGGVVVLVIAGIGAATVAVFSANASLSAEQARTAGLLVEQRKFGSVTSVQAQVNDIKAAQTLGVDGEVAWQPYFGTVQATLLPGMSITSIQTTLATASQAAGTEALQAPYIATVLIEAHSPKAQISDWLKALGTLKGFVDANPGNVQLDETSGDYTVNVVMHVNSDALADRFVAGKK